MKKRKVSDICFKSVSIHLHSCEGAELLLFLTSLGHHSTRGRHEEQWLFVAFIHTHITSSGGKDATRSLKGSTTTMTTEMGRTMSRIWR